MKKRILIAAITLFTMTSLHAADNIGVIDLDRISQNYKEYETIVKDLKTKREEYQKFLEEKQTEIEKAKQDKEKEEKLKERVQKLETEIRGKQEEILKNEADKQRNLLGKVIETAKVVAKEYGIDVVLDKRVAYIGGFDLTEFVLDRLNKK